MFRFYANTLVRLFPSLTISTKDSLDNKECRDVSATALHRLW